jgi:hypothetical protein
MPSFAICLSSRISTLTPNAVRRLGDEISREAHRLRQMLQRRERLARPRHVRDQDVERLEARLLLFLLARAVLVETIGAQPRPERDIRRHVRRRQGGTGQIFHRQRAQRLADAVEMGQQIAAQRLQPRRVDLLDLAQAHEHDARHRQPLGRHDVEHIVLAALETARPHGARQHAASLLVEGRRRRRQLAVFEHPHDIRAGSGRFRLGKRDFHGEWPRERWAMEDGPHRTAGPRDCNDSGADEKAPDGG